MFNKNVMIYCVNIVALIGLVALIPEVILSSLNNYFFNSTNNI